MEEEFGFGEEKKEGREKRRDILLIKQVFRVSYLMERKSTLD
jgi:hypothetical protein